MKNFPYNTYSCFLKKKYGEKIYKLPIKINATCPNRDGLLGYGGCIFCGIEGGSFENLNYNFSITEQLEINREKISKKYGVNKFIAYFQNFTNTYINLGKFKNMVEEAANSNNIVGISISTRPDCITRFHLDILKELEIEKNLDICLELGLQTANYQILKKLNRGHGLAEFIRAQKLIKEYGFESCVHIIIGLPGENMEDVVETSKILSVLEVDFVKIHSLYILKNTALGKMYLKNKITLIEKQEYINRVIEFLRYLSSDIVVERVIGRAPEEDSLFCNWGNSWWVIRDEIIKIMTENGIYQGDKTFYMEGINK